MIGEISMIKKVASVLLVVILLLTCSVSADAYQLLGKELIGGVGNSGNNTRYYWLSNDAIAYTSTINAAMYAWNHTATTPGVTTKIWFQPVASKTYSVMDIYTSTDMNGAYGQTWFFGTNYDDTSKVNPRNSNWRWCKISLYVNYFTSNNLTSSTGHTLQSTVAHEMGHVFGLDENNTMPNTVMAQARARSTSVIGPSRDDCNGVNALY